MDKEKTETPQRGTCAKQSSRIKINSRINPQKWLAFAKEALVGSLGFEPRTSNAPGWDPKPL
jgi:hypothetical protein